MLKLPRPTASAKLVLGAAVHHALAEAHARLAAGEVIRLPDLVEALRSCWSVRESEEAIGYRRGESREKLLADGESLLGAYLTLEPPADIAAVERRLWAPLSDSHGETLETPLVAALDLITGKPGRLTVHEFKTSGRAYSQVEADLSLQASFYAQAVSENFGELPAIEFVVLVRTRTPKVQRLTVRRTKEDLERLGDIVATVDRAVRLEVFYPVETPLNCVSCPYWGPCREWNPPACSDRDKLVTIGGPG